MMLLNQYWDLNVNLGYELEGDLEILKGNIVIPYLIFWSKSKK